MHRFVCQIGLCAILFSVVYAVSLGSNYVTCQAAADQAEDVADPTANEELGKTTAQLAQLRGFTANNYNITNKAGYVLNIVQSYSPLVNSSTIASRRPVLFVHGFVNNGNTWLVNSRGAQPQDYSNICPNATQEQLLQLAQTDLGFNSMPITFMNCGRQVWLLNRQGNTQSRGYSNPNLAPYDSQASNIAQTAFGGIPALGGLLGNLTSPLPSVDGLSPLTGTIDSPLNPRYWNFSLDDEAQTLIEVVSFVLKQTNQTKLDLVTHSSGGQITLMALSMQTNFSASLNKIILYAPAMYLGLGSENALAAPLLPVLVSYLGQFPPNFLLYPGRALIEAVCTPAVASDSICSIALQLILGPATMSPLRSGYTEGLLDTTSAHQFAQLIRTSLQLKTHRFDYLDPIRNQIAYGSPVPPLYDVSVINATSFAIWTSNSDGLVPSNGVFDLIADLRVPVEQHFINEPGVLWNHFSYFFNEYMIPAKVSIPSVLYLESS